LCAAVQHDEKGSLVRHARRQVVVRQTWRSGLGRRTLGTDPGPRRQGR
jgi:hypothetical protein